MFYEEKQSYIYILASQKVGTLYTGVTSDLIRRVTEHRESIQDGFTKKHRVDKLVHYETYGSIELAIEREKKLKKWRRAWKIQLIEQANPDWNDLYPDLLKNW